MLLRPPIKLPCSLYILHFIYMKQIQFIVILLLEIRKSKIESAYFLKFNKKRSISLKTNFSNQYDAGGKDALVDGLRGPNNYLTGRWQGFYGKDFECNVDLGSKECYLYKYRAIQDVRSWIWLPKKVEFLFASTDGKIFKSIGTFKALYFR